MPDQPIGRKGFLSTLSLRRATDVVSTTDQGIVFLSTLSLRRATGKITNKRLDERISIHALLAESDTGVFVASYCVRLFLSTLSLRRATHLRSLLAHRGGISIHALLAESDANGRCARIVPGISIHGVAAAGLVRQFLSTLSLRRATYGRAAGIVVRGHFYPRSPCGERRPPAAH